MKRLLLPTTLIGGFVMPSYSTISAGDAASRSPAVENMPGLDRVLMIQHQFNRCHDDYRN